MFIYNATLYLFITAKYDGNVSGDAWTLPS